MTLSQYLGPSPQRLLVPAALFGVYVVWGSTYLALRYMVIPPLLGTGLRFAAAGALLGRWTRVFDQAENRLHAQKSVMALTM